jgi:hypothetical protein
MHCIYSNALSMLFSKRSLFFHSKHSRASFVLLYQRFGSAGYDLDANFRGLCFRRRGRFSVLWVPSGKW